MVMLWLQHSWAQCIPMAPMKLQLSPLTLTLRESSPKGIVTLSTTVLTVGTVVLNECQLLSLAASFLRFITVTTKHHNGPQVTTMTSILATNHIGHDYISHSETISATKKCLYRPQTILPHPYRPQGETSNFLLRVDCRRHSVFTFQFKFMSQFKCVHFCAFAHY